jgi:phosphatidylethanolamine/phosphatidyl-N-methylethanolamine N-methyltransferase
MKRFFREHVEFLRQYRVRFQTTGAVAPSSRFLARALTRPLARHQGPARILEVGPGTGAVTRRISKLLKPEDTLDLVELNDRFVDILNRRLQDDPLLKRVADRTRVHHMAIQEFTAPQPYDFIVCGLPFNNFPPELVREIFAVFFRLLAPHGVLSYFEYMYMRPLRKMVSGKPARDRLHELDGVLNDFLGKHRYHRDWVFVNVPPAWVQHLRHTPD